MSICSSISTSCLDRRTSYLTPFRACFIDQRSANTATIRMIKKNTSMLSPYLFSSGTGISLIIRCSTASASWRRAPLPVAILWPSTGAATARMSSGCT